MEGQYKEIPKGMVLIPAGSFIMGAPLDGPKMAENDEAPPHKVTVSSFYMDICPVTQAEFEKVMGFNPSYFANAPFSPVECVTRPQALEYCRRAGKRLPTEAEWEYAARAGTTGLAYWEDEDWQDYAFLHPNGGFRTKGAGLKKPNAFGLYDVIGNVWEWCSDWYDAEYYMKSPEVDPKGPASGTEGVLRGCCWYTGPEAARVTRRRREKNPDSPFEPSILGFRCAL